MIKAILFDRDGVIINSELTNIQSVIETFKEFNITISDDEKNLIVARHPVDYVKDFEKRYSFSVEDFLISQKKNYHRLFSSVEIFDEMVNLIKKLKLNGYLLALTTSSEMSNTKEILKTTGLNNIFDTVITFEDCKERKPNPESYLITAEKLGLKPEECIVVEDSQVGLEAAKNANMKCIVIPNEYTEKQDFTKANYIISKADEIEDILNNQK